ncbi:hypothetical protein [Rhizobium sp. NRK18]|uniref:hypothetical protein n=1 Tax=Rhizobium sp. NRK18 TaxID=2964667 RepID=UPI0021C42504|nr:hypothetical protein [Rhizobium sp. NRK18]MCQ2002358.1 hypothetical protein [Rhizobium sp. NRK18]
MLAIKSFIGFIAVLTFVHCGCSHALATDTNADELQLIGLALYSPAGEAVDGFNRSEQGKGYVLSDVISKKCSPRTLTYAEDGGPSSGKSVYMTAICSNSGNNTIGLVKYSLEFDRLANDLLGKGWGSIDSGPPYSLLWHPTDITGSILDTSRRLHLFGELRENGNQPNPGVFVQRLLETGSTDHTFSVEGVGTLTDEHLGNMGSLSPNGIAYISRPGLVDGGSSILLFSISPDGIERTVEIQVGIDGVVPVGVTVGEDDHLYVYGHTRQTIGRRLFIARLNASGDGIDETFGAKGVVSFDFGEQSPEAIKVKFANGKIYFLGLLSVQNRSNPHEIQTFPAVAVLKADGTLDASFSGDGRRILEFASRRNSPAYPHFKDFSVAKNGRIYLVGAAKDNVAIVAIDRSGEIELGFGQARNSEGGLLLDRSFNLPGSKELKSAAGVASDIDIAGNLIVLVSITASPKMSADE